MLGKLLKYEIKATRRQFLPLYLVIILFAIINRIINPFNRTDNSITIMVESSNLYSFLQLISMMVYFTLIVGLIVLSLIILIQRFYKNLLGEEGYLMFTLPVKPSEHIISKLLIGLMWLILSFLTVLASILILVSSPTLFEDLRMVFSQVREFIGDTLLLLIPIYGLIAGSTFILSVYNALSIGQLFTRYKILYSFISYIGIYFIGQIISFIYLVSYIPEIRKFKGVFEFPTQASIIKFVLPLLIIDVLLGVANFISANLILNKRLNLE